MIKSILKLILWVLVVSVICQVNIFVAEKIKQPPIIDEQPVPKIIIEPIDIK